MPSTLAEQLKQVDAPTLTIPGLDLPDGWHLRPYQARDVAHLILTKRDILAELPAAGKKLIAIAAALKLFSTGQAQNALVVSTGPDVDQWIEEVHKVTDDLITVEAYRGDPKTRAKLRNNALPDFHVCTYETARADHQHLKGKYEIVILDEISFLRNYESAAHRALAIICESASFAWGLSATPFEVGPIDLFSLLSAILGRASPLGSDGPLFEENHCVVDRFKVKTKWGLKEIKKVRRLRPTSVPIVKEKVAHHHIRHPRDEVQKYLPAMQIKTVALEMGKHQASRYADIAEGSLVTDLLRRDGQRTKTDVTTALKLHYLLRCADGLNSLPGQERSDSIKLDWTMDALTSELAGERTVVYSRYHQPLDDLETKLRREGLRHARIDGRPDRTEEDVTAARKALFNGELDVLLITNKAAYAMELQAADYGIAYNRPWNPRKIEQLHGRIRRPGGGDHKTWFHLLACPAELEQWELLDERMAQADELDLGSEDDLFLALDAAAQQLIVNALPRKRR